MGNPTSWKGQARTFNLNNQETTGGTSQFNYDGNGNPTTYKGSSFAFNENDKLTRITTAGSVALQAGYHSDGLRGWKNTANGTTFFLYDGSRLLCEFDGSGTLKNTNVWGANGLLARRDEVASSTRFYLWDDKGNIAQSLNANGSVAANFNVSAWGDVARDVGTADVYAGLGGRFGNYFDVETGLLLCGQRYYDAGAGRWINRDPISYAGGLNVYGYVGNNPINRVDPSGLYFGEGIVDGGRKWFWTGDPNASNEVYNGATDAAADWMYNCSPTRGAYVEWTPNRKLRGWQPRVNAGWTVDSGWGFSGSMNYSKTLGPGIDEGMNGSGGVSYGWSEAGGWRKILTVPGVSVGIRPDLKGSLSPTSSFVMNDPMNPGKTNFRVGVRDTRDIKDKGTGLGFGLVMGIPPGLESGVSCDYEG